MKIREFDINNYKIEDIIKEEIQKAADAYIKGFKHEFMLEDSKLPYYASPFSVKIKPFTDMTKKEQDSIEKLALKQYEEKKASTIKEWEDIKTKCEYIVKGDKHYLKFLPELTDLYYCQAVTALKDYRDKKLHSNAAANARYKVRAMRYSTISCY